MTPAGKIHGRHSRAAPGLVIWRFDLGSARHRVMAGPEQPFSSAWHCLRRSVIRSERTTPKTGNRTQGSPAPLTRVGQGCQPRSRSVEERVLQWVEVVERHFDTDRDVVRALCIISYESGGNENANRDRDAICEPGSPVTLSKGRLRLWAGPGGEVIVDGVRQAVRLAHALRPTTRRVRATRVHLTASVRGKSGKGGFSRDVPGSLRSPVSGRQSSLTWGNTP
jgi:hypothetical protein